MLCAFSELSQAFLFFVVIAPWRIKILNDSEYATITNRLIDQLMNLDQLMNEISFVLKIKRD